MIALHLQLALILLAVSVQPFAVPLFLEKSLHGTEIVFLFIALWAAVAVLSLPVGLFITAKRRWVLPCMWVGLVCLSTHYVLLGTFDNTSEMTILIAALLFGAHCGLFWLPRHILVSYHVSTHVVGSMASSMQIIAIAIGVVSPIVVGIASEALPGGTTFLFAAGLTLLSGLPLFLPQLKVESWTDPYVTTRDLFLHPIGRAVRRLHFFEGITEIWFAVGWVFIFAHHIGSIAEFGFVIGLATLVAGTASILSGNRFHLHESRSWLFRRLTLLRGVLIACYSLIPLITLDRYHLAIMAIVTESLFRIVESGHATLRLGYIYGLSRTLSPVAYQVNRELGLNCGRVTAGVLLACGIMLMGDTALIIGVAIASFAQCGWLLLEKLDHHLINDRPGIA